MSLRVRRTFVISVLAACAMPLVFVALGRAGSKGASFDIAIGPSRISAGAEAFVMATFTPASGPGSGTAKHVVVTLRLPGDFTSPQASGCSADDEDDEHGDSSTGETLEPAHGGSGNEFRCNLGTVHKGETVKRFITFTAASVSQPKTYTVTGTARFDTSSKPYDKSAKSGGNGHGNRLSASSSATVYAANDPNHQGKCVELSGDSTATVGATATASNPKGTAAVFGAADPSLGLPCTPAAGGVDPEINVPGFTSGVWFVSLPQLSSSGVARVTLTFFKLPWGTSWKHFKVFELPGYPGDLTVNPNPVQPCTWGGTLPSGQTSCVYSRSKFGYDGVKLGLLVKGTGVDPGYAG